MKKSRIIKRAIVLAILIFAVSALATYTISYIGNHEKDPLEGRWVDESMELTYAVVFKRGKTYVQMDTGIYSNMKYEITSVEQKGDSLYVATYLSDDNNSYQQVYEIRDGDTLIIDDMELKKQ